MQQNLYIFIQMPDGTRAVSGRLLYEKLADGLTQSYFRYEPSWVTTPEAFPLDPVNLPLKTEVFQLKSRTGLWGVLEDALPDAWGRRLLHARHTVNVSRSNNIELLLLTGWAEPGATGFSNSRKMTRHPVVPMDLEKTGQAISASEAFEKKEGIVNLPDFFISGGSSVGGARPKVLARSGDDLYLVKFPSVNDPAPDIMARLELFGMSCVRLAGIPTPDCFLIQAAWDRMALAVKRFDTVKKSGRLHFLSFQSLIGIEEQLGLPYARMAEVIQKVSVYPEQDLKSLYKQMVVNVILCNCDDHLKNFSMRYDPAGGGFCLTPAYDVVPNLWQREHILSIGGRVSEISRGDLIQEGDSFSLGGQQIKKLINEAVQGVSQALMDNSRMVKQLSASCSLCCRLLDTVQENLERVATWKNAGQP